MAPTFKEKLLASVLRGGSTLQSRATGSTLLNQTPGIGSLGISQYFQDQPITEAQLRLIYGDPSDFMASYQEWADSYYRAIRDHKNLALGKRIDADFEESIGNINLKLLNREVQQALYDEYMNKVVRIDKLLEVVGLPVVETPSGNKFNHPMRYLVESGNLADTHPAKLLLNRLFFNYNDRKSGSAAIGVGKDRILNPVNMHRTMRSFTSGSYFSGLAEDDLIATLDIETTGPFEHSQLRSISVAAKRFQSGTLTPPSIITSKMFDSPQLGGIVVGRPGGPLRTMTDLLTEMQSGTHEAFSMNQMMDEMAGIFEELMSEESPGVYKYKRLVGHNIGFDLTKITHTLQGIEGFPEHTRLKEAMRAFFQRQAGGDFVYDTLDIAREYFNNKAIEYSMDPNIDDMAKKYIDNLFSQEMLAKVHIGGSAAPFSMENIALNSDLFRLMIEDGQASHLYDLISKGSHMDDTDTILQDYVLKYIHEGRLDIDFRAAPTGPLSPDEEDKLRLIRAARAKVSQSQAITPTTNIADVRHLSDMAFDYFTTNEGLSKVSININADVIAALEEAVTSGELASTKASPVSRVLAKLKGTGEGVLRFDDEGRAKISKKGGSSLIAAKSGGGGFYAGFDDATKDIFRFILNQARNPSPTLSLVNRAIAGSPDPINVMALAINDIGASYQSVSRAEQMKASYDATLRVGRTISSSSDILNQDVLEGFGSVYDAYGSGLGYGDRTTLSRMSGQVEGFPFEMGLGRFDMTVPERVAESLAKIGDPFAFIDPKSRVLSTIIAGITASTGKAMNTASMQAGGIKEGFELADVAFSAKPDITAELGLGYFREQQASSFMRFVEESQREASKLVVPTRIVQAAFDDVKGAVPDTLRRLGLSVNQYTSDNINLVWNISEQLGKDEHRQVLENIVKIYADTDAVKAILGDIDADIMESVTKDINAVKARISYIDDKGDLKIDDIEVQKLVDELMETSERGGIVVGNLDELMTESLMAQAEKLGINLTNEALENFRTSVLRTASTASGVVVAPFVDMVAAEISDLTGGIDAANKIENRGGVLVSESMDAYNRIGSKFEDTGLLSDVAKRVARAKGKVPPTPMADFYRANKSKIGIGLAVTGLASFAYYRSKKKREESIYNEVVQKQPYESSRQLDPLSDVKAVYSYERRNLDPLATAGVVGELDRNKIGHTRMGNDRNNHLFDLG